MSLLFINRVTHTYAIAHRATKSNDKYAVTVAIVRNPTNLVWNIVLSQVKMSSTEATDHHSTDQRRPTIQPTNQSDSYPDQAQ